MTNDKEIAAKINKAVFPGLQGGPHNHITAGIAVALKEAMQDEFKDYASQIVKNAKALANALSNKGWKIITGGTDNHLMLVDVTAAKIEGLAGKTASHALEEANISVNKNTIPHDPRKPWDPSGIRVGTPAITTRGMKESDMEVVATLIDKALRHYTDHDYLAKLKQEVKEFTSPFPIPGLPKIWED